MSNPSEKDVSDLTVKAIIIVLISILVIVPVLVIFDAVRAHLSYTDSRGTVCMNKDVAAQCDPDEVKDQSSVLYDCDRQCNNLVYDLDVSDRKKVLEMCRVKTCHCRWGCPGANDGE
jgi:hypothetical protein